MPASTSAAGIRIRPGGAGRTPPTSGSRRPTRMLDPALDRDDRVERARLGRDAQRRQVGEPGERGRARPGGHARAPLPRRPAGRARPPRPRGSASPRPSRARCGAALGATAARAGGQRHVDARRRRALPGGPRAGRAARRVLAGETAEPRRGRAARGRRAVGGDDRPHRLAAACRSRTRWTTCRR